VVMDIDPPVDSLRGVGSGCLSPGFPWCDGPSGVGGISKMVLPGWWFVSNCWSLLPTGQVAIELYGHSLFSSLPDSPRCLSSSQGNCVAPPPLWLWQISASINKVEQFRVVRHPQFPLDKLSIPSQHHSGRWTQHFTLPQLQEVSSVFHPTPTRQR
jgi:hypothetical protein